jgi:hypothetical protein
LPNYHLKISKPLFEPYSKYGYMYVGQAVAQLVGALRYKPEVRGFDS